jgi:thiamine-phosphate pyrophosphorylase
MTPTLDEAIRGFYAVLDRDDEALARVLLAHAKVLQVRIKPRTLSVPSSAVDVREVVRIARMARRVCDELGAALIINDRLDVALTVGADGVHLGQSDLPLAEARSILARAGRRLWIGLSTHDLQQVREGCAAGADYLGFGPVFATTTKANPDAVQGIGGLRDAVAAAGSVPVVAIGGITPAHARDVYVAGARAICAIGSVNDAADVGASASLLHNTEIARDSKLWQDASG